MAELANENGKLELLHCGTQLQGLNEELPEIEIASVEEWSLYKNMSITQCDIQTVRTRTTLLSIQGLGGNCLSLPADEKPKFCASMLFTEIISALCPYLE